MGAASDRPIQFDSEPLPPIIWIIINGRQFFGRPRRRKIMRSMVVAGLTAVAMTTSAAAQEVTLRAVSSFAEGTEFSKNFERFVEKVPAT